jgi:hypothetical protein
LFTKEIAGLPSKKKTMELFGKDTVVSFYLTQHTHRAAIKVRVSKGTASGTIFIQLISRTCLSPLILPPETTLKKYGSLEAMEAKRAQKQEMKSAKVSDKQKRLSLLNAALSNAGADLRIRLSSKRALVASRLVIGDAIGDGDAATELWRYISTGKFDMPKKKRAKKEHDLAPGEATVESTENNIPSNMPHAEAIADVTNVKQVASVACGPRKRMIPDRFVAESSAAFRASSMNSTAPASTMAAPATVIPKPALNSRIQTHWPGPKPGWYDAQVIGYSKTKRQHKIKYADESTEWLDFGEKEHRWRSTAWQTPLFKELVVQPAPGPAPAPAREKRCGGESTLQRRQVEALADKVAKRCGMKRARETFRSKAGDQLRESGDYLGRRSWNASYIDEASTKFVKEGIFTTEALDASVEGRCVVSKHTK